MNSPHKGGDTPPRPIPDSVWYGVLLLGALLLLGWGIGSYSLWDPWEPKYAVAIDEMRARGELLVPYLHDEIRWTKPILIYWAMYVPVAIFGNSEWAVRLPSVLGACAGVLWVFFFVSRLMGRRAGLMAACVLGTLPQYVYMARQAMPDMLLTVFLAGSMGSLALARFGDSRRRAWNLVFWASLGLAVLTKGPVAGAVVVASVGLFWLVDLEPWGWRSVRDVWSAIVGLWRDYDMGRGLLLFAAVAAPWYVAVLLRHGNQFIDSFVMGENLHRFSEPVRDHHGTAQYYVKHFFHGMYPWAGLLPVSLLFLFHGSRGLDEQSRREWYWASWALGTFLLFTIAGTKIDHYILPILPVIAVLVARVWQAYFDDDPPFWVRPSLIVSVPLLWITVRDFQLEGDRYLFNVFNNARDIDYPGLPTALNVLLVAWALAMLAAAFVPRSRVVAGLAVAVAAGGMIYMTQFVMPYHTAARTMKPYVEEYKARSAGGQAELVFYGKIRYTTHYYMDGEPFEKFERGELEELIRHVRGKDRVYIIARSSDAARAAQPLRSGTGKRWFVVGNGHPRYVLLSNVAPGG